MKLQKITIWYIIKIEAKKQNKTYKLFIYILHSYNFSILCIDKVVENYLFNSKLLYENDESTVTLVQFWNIWYHNILADLYTINTSNIIYGRDQSSGVLQSEM